MFLNILGGGVSPPPTLLNFVGGFLPAAKPTGLLEANSCLFFLFFFLTKFKKGPKQAYTVQTNMVANKFGPQIPNLRSDLTSEAVWRLL